MNLFNHFILYFINFIFIFEDFIINYYLLFCILYSFIYLFGLNMMNRHKRAYSIHAAIYVVCIM